MKARVVELGSFDGEQDGEYTGIGLVEMLEISSAQQYFGYLLKFNTIVFTVVTSPCELNSTHLPPALAEIIYLVMLSFVTRHTMLAVFDR